MGKPPALSEFASVLAGTQTSGRHSATVYRKHSQLLTGWEVGSGRECRKYEPDGKPVIFTGKIKKTGYVACIGRQDNFEKQDSLIDKAGLINKRALANKKA
ncbi:hypothetical protein [Photobacterium ganghwense]|uniref:hypothetical protein n=1 Tax=Photobacterium ganghwense TaxID=320778 RepID=UPI001C2D1644|nr:hypothetical protein [Photobacterium ganghwense]MBV1841225.1 hypothetical protein [Photobacterium ganghwense]